MADAIKMVYEADMSSLDKGLNDAIAANLKLDQSAQKAAKSVGTIEDGFVKGSDGAKRFEREVNRTVKTQADMEVKLANLKELLRDEAKIGTQAYKDIANEIKKTEKEQAKLADSTKSGMDKLKGVPGVIGGIATSIGGATKAAITFMANPIGATIAVIAGGLMLLFKAFTSTDEGGTKFAGVMSAIKAVIDVVMQRVSMIAEGITAVFSGNWTEAADKFSGAVSGMGEQMRQAANAAYQYELALDALQDKELQYTTQSLQNQRRIAQLESDAMDRTKGVKEREAALLESVRIAEMEVANQKKFAEERYQLELKQTADRYNVSISLLDQYIKADQKGAEQLLAQNKSLYNARNQFNDAGEQNLRTHYNKVIELDTSFFNETKRSQGKISGFREQENAKREAQLQKQREAERKANEKRIQDEILLQDLRIANMEDGLGKELAARNLAYVRAQEQHKGNAEILLEIERQYDLDIEKLANKYQNGEIEKRKEQERQIQDIITTARRDATVAKLSDQDKELFELEEFYAAKLALVAGNEEAIALLTQEWDSKKAVIDQTYREKDIEETQRINDAKLELTQTLADSTVAIGQALIQDQAQLAQFQKAMALFQIGIDSAVAIAGVIRAASTTSLTPIDQALKIAAGTAVVLTNVAKAKQLLTEAPAYKEGVIDFQGKGTSTSDSNLAWISNHETIMTGNETKEHKDLFWAIRKKRYDEFILSRYVMPAVNAAKSNDMAAKMHTSIKMNNLDDTRIVSALMKIKPATSKDIDRLGNKIATSMNDAAFKSSKKWQA